MRFANMSDSPETQINDFGFNIEVMTYNSYKLELEKYFARLKLFLPQRQFSSHEP